MSITLNGTTGVTTTGLTSNGIDDNATSTAITIDALENVGIGTSSPAALLDLKHNSASTHLRLTENTSGNWSAFGVDTSDNLRMYVNNSERMRIDANGAVTMPHQPAFLARPVSNQNNIAVGSHIDVVFGTEVFDQNSDFTSNTFTAPVAGRYQLNFSLRLQEMDSAASYIMCKIVTSNRDYESIFDPDFGQDAQYWNPSLGVLADMDANDTARVTFFQGVGAAQTDIHTQSHFSGYLVA